MAAKKKHVDGIIAAAAEAFDNSPAGVMARNFRNTLRDHVTNQHSLATANAYIATLTDKMNNYIAAMKEHADNKIADSKARESFFEQLADKLDYPTDSDEDDDADKDPTYHDEDELKINRRPPPSLGYRDGNSFNKDMRFGIVCVMSSGESASQAPRTWEMLKFALGPMFAVSPELVDKLPNPSRQSMSQGIAALSMLCRVWGAGLIHCGGQCFVSNDGTSVEGEDIAAGIFKTKGVPGIQLPGGVYPVASKGGKEGQQQFKARTEQGFQWFEDMLHDLTAAGVDIVPLFKDLLGDKGSLTVYAEELEYTMMDDKDWATKFIDARLQDPLTRGRWFPRIKRTMQDNARNENKRDKLLLEDIKAATLQYVPGFASMTEEQQAEELDFFSLRCDDHAFKLEIDEGIKALGKHIGVNIVNILYELCKLTGRLKRGMYHFSKQKQIERLMGRLVQFLPHVGTRIVMHQNAMRALEVSDELMPAIFDELVAQRMSDLGMSVYTTFTKQRVVDGLFVMSLLWWHILGVVRMFINKSSNDENPRVRKLPMRDYVKMHQEKVKVMQELKTNGALLLDAKKRNCFFSNVNVKQAQMDHHGDWDNIAIKKKMRAVEEELNQNATRRQDVVKGIEAYALGYEVKADIHSMKFMPGGSLAPETVEKACKDAKAAMTKAKQALSDAKSQHQTNAAKAMIDDAKSLTEKAASLKRRQESLFRDIDDGWVDHTVTKT